MHGRFVVPPRRIGARFIVLGSVGMIVALCFSAALAGAHSPSDISLSYNATAGELAVTITHPAADPAKHYVKEVQVSVDGQMVKTSAYTSQPAATPFTYIYPLQAPAGSRIEVQAPCILGGSLTRTLQVPGPKDSATEKPGMAPSATKAAATIVPVLGLFFLPLWKRKGRFR